MDPFLGTQGSWQQVGLDDQNAARKNWQLNQKPLELYNEKEEWLAYVYLDGYLFYNADLISKKKTSYLSRNEVG